MQVGLSESWKLCLKLCSRDDLRQGAILWDISVLYYQCNFFRVCRRPDERENTFLENVTISELRIDKSKLKQFFYNKHYFLSVQVIILFLYLLPLVSVQSSS